MHDLLIHGMLFAAAMLQGVTGIGFALIAGPVLLLALDGAVAVPITAVLTWMLSLLLIAGAARSVDRALLARFMLASVAAAPIGLAMLLAANPAALKLLAGAVIGLLTIVMLWGAAAKASKPGARSDYAAGALAGAMGGALAILGPPVALRMTAQNVPKTRNRATVLAYFVLVYPVVFLGHSLIGVGGGGALASAMSYAPASVAGAVVGWLLTPHVSEALFRRIVALVLISTTASLIVDGLSDIGG